MAFEILTFMNPSEILRDVKLNTKPKPKGPGSALEETQPDHRIYSALTSTKLPSIRRRTTI